MRIALTNLLFLLSIFSLSCSRSKKAGNVESLPVPAAASRVQEIDHPDLLLAYWSTGEKRLWVVTQHRQVVVEQLRIQATEIVEVANGVKLATAIEHLAPGVGDVRVWTKKDCTGSASSCAQSCTDIGAGTYRTRTDVYSLGTCRVVTYDSR